MMRIGMGGLMARRSLLILLGCTLSALCSSDVWAGYIFTRMADTDTAVPGSPDASFSFFRAPVLDRRANGTPGSVAFVGETSGRGVGVYLAVKEGSAPPEIRRLADTDTFVPGQLFRTYWTFNEDIALSDGVVAFSATFPLQFGGFPPGIYLADSSAPGNIVAAVPALTTVPGTPDPNFVFNFVPHVTLDQGDLAFAGYTGIGGYGGVYAQRDGGLSPVADTFTEIPERAGTFDIGSSFPSIHHGQIAFRGSHVDAGGNTGVYLSPGNGAPLQVLATNQTEVDGVQLGSLFTYVSLDDGRVAFVGHRAVPTSPFELFLWQNGALMPVAGQATNLPDGAMITGVGSPSLRGSLLAFRAETSTNGGPTNGVGVYVAHDDRVQKVIGSSDLLGGRNVENVDFSTDGMNDAGQLVFRADFAAGDQAIYRATPFNPPAPGTRVEQSLLPPLNPKPNLVLIVHGWRGSTDDAWVVEMQDVIEAKLFSTPGIDPALWQVRTYDWRDQAAGTILIPRTAVRALRNGISLGDIEGPILADQHFEHVHLISHSAGAGFIDEVTRWITSLSPSTAVHQTFLDPFVIGANWRQWGERATWADNYVNSADEIVFGTRPTLPHAHNVDVTNLRPGGPAGGDDGHQWPHEFYTASVNGTLAGAEGWGYPLSLEAGYGLPVAWNPQNEYAIGQSPVVLPRDPAPIVDSIPDSHTTVVAHAPYNFEALGTAISDTGTVQLAGTNLSMTTGSPVWLAAAVDVLDTVNFLSFDFEFTSDALSEGLFGVYWDDELLGTIDERFIPAGPHELTFGLTEDETMLGTHVIAFRLDPYSEAASSVYLTNVHTGYVAVVPEPSTLAMCFSALATLAVFAIKRLRIVKPRCRCR